MKHCHHQDRSEIPKWKDHSGGDTPRGEASIEGSNGQWNLGVSVAQLCAKKVHPWEIWSHIQLGASEALAGGMVSKLRQEMLLGRAIGLGDLGAVRDGFKSLGQ